MMGNNGTALLSAAAAAMLLVTAGCGGQRGEDTRAAALEPTSCEVTADARLSIATGNTTGVYYTLGGAYAEAISQQTAGTLKATAAETSASLQNIQQVVAGTHQVAFSLADTAADAANGTASFSEKQPIAALTRLYPNYTQVIARTDADINSIADMRGKRVSTGAPNSGTEVIANRMLEAAGLDPSTDIQAQRTELGKTVEGVKDGSIDAMFWSGGLPTGGITDLFVSERDNVKFVDATDTLAKLQRINPIYERGVIPASTYQTPADVPTVVVPNVLLVKDDMDGNTACVLTKALYEHKADLVKANKAAKGIALDTARQTSPVPLHPGAKRALDELGAAG
jgi:TRAP transporter TAXI family solute receptor